MGLIQLSCQEKEDNFFIAIKKNIAFLRWLIQDWLIKKEVRNLTNLNQ